jgi:hypothetical protein
MNVAPRLSAEPWTRPATASGYWASTTVLVAVEVVVLVVVAVEVVVSVPAQA